MLGLTQRRSREKYQLLTLPFVILAGSALGLGLGACSSDSGPSDPPAAAPATSAPGTPNRAGASAQPFAPVVASSELAVGENRFALGIIDNGTGNPLPDAQVHFRFFTVQGTQGTLRFEADPRFVAPARDAGIAGMIQHRHADGTNHPHANVESDVGVYVAPARFDQTGKWAVEATFRAPDGREGKLTAPFDVLAQSTSPAVGSAAPARAT